MNIRLTKKRQAILDVLKNSKEAMSAKEIHSAVTEADLATVYRSLDLFVSEKMISELNFDGDEALYEYQHEPHHHAVCTDCGKVIHFNVEEGRIKELLCLTGFDIKDIELTVRGSCAH